MCLAIPGKVIAVTDEGGLKMGRIDYAGTIKSACLECVPEAQPGQYVLVHAGFAIGLLDEEEAQKTLALWSDLELREAQQTSAPGAAHPNGPSDTGGAEDPA